MIKSSFIIVIFLVLYQNAIAQINFEKESFTKQNQRFAFENKLFSLENQEVLRTIIEDGPKANETKISCIKYDTALNVLWKSEFSGLKNFEFKKQYFDSTNLYFLFQHFQKPQLKLLNFNKISGLVEEFDVRLSHEILIGHFAVIQKQLVLAGKIKDLPVLESYRLFDSQLKVLQPKMSKSIIFADFEYFKNRLYVLTFDEKICETKIIQYDTLNNLLSTQTIGDSFHKVIEAKIVNNQNEVLVMGTFSNYCNINNHGYFIKKLDQDSVRYFQYQNFSNIFSNLSKNRQEKIKAKVEKNKKINNLVNFRSRLNQPFFEQNKLITFSTELCNEANVKATLAFNSSGLNFSICNGIFAEFDQYLNPVFDYNFKFEASREAFDLNFFSKNKKHTVVYLTSSQLVINEVDENTLKQSIRKIELEMKPNFYFENKNLLKLSPDNMLLYGNVHDSIGQNYFYMGRFKP